MADMIQLLRAAEATYAGRIAVRAGRNVRTFEEVASRSDRVATMLRELNGPTGLVVLLVGNRIEAVELDIALIKAGLGRVSLNPRLALDEIHHVIRDASPRVLVYDPAHADLADQLTSDFPDMQCLRLGSARTGPGHSYEERLAACAPTQGTLQVAPDDPSLVMYTSGTTGRPKGAVWTFRSRSAAVRNMLINELDAASARNMIHVGSLSHGSGSKVVPVYIRGGCNVIFERFDPEQFLAEARELEATATFMVPTMVKMLVEASESVGGNPLAAMRHIAYGGAKMPLPTIQAGIERFGSIFFQVYGSCEAPHPMLLLNHEDHATGDARILTSAGRPSIGVDMRIGSPDELPGPGEHGEILLRAPSVMDRYWNDSSATEEVLKDGYYHTGDVGVVHDDGIVEIVDRIKNMIISGGFNVYPAEVERVLASHPGVSQVSVYGLPDDHWGEIVAASVVRRNGAVTDADLSQYCADRLAGYKKPREIAFVTEFPLGPTGKVLTSALRRRHRESTLGTV